MMRRARWLAAGAVLGAVGYQRLHRAARSPASQSEQPSVARQVVGAVGLAASAAGHTAGAVGWLARQVRRIRAAGFIGDVRQGMDDYIDRHQANMNRQDRRSGNTLVAQRAPDRPAIPGGPGWRQQDDKTKDGR